MDCLVTKLKGAVVDDSLMKLGELRIKKLKSPNWDYPSQILCVSLLKDETLTIIGDGNFTDKSGSENKGKSVFVKANEDTELYISNSDAEISIPDKYSIRQLLLSKEDYPVPQYGYNTEIVGGLESLAHCTNLYNLTVFSTGVQGDLSSLSKLAELTILLLSNTEVTGDLSNIKDLPLARLYVNNTNITGDISLLSNMKLLERFQLYGAANITGDIEVASNWKNLNTFYGPSSQVYGSVDALSGLNNLSIMDFSNKDFTGDYFNILSQHGFERFLVCGTFTYSTKNFSGKTYKRIGGDHFVCNNLDDFLNDFQQVNSTTGGAIIMLGTRTTASDSAVTALQGKGFTVSVPDATDAISLLSASDGENFGIAYKGKVLIVEPVDLSKQQIYPASGVTVETFATKEEAESYIKKMGLEYEHSY